jgi:hypothetical protein
VKLFGPAFGENSLIEAESLGEEVVYVTQEGTLVLGVAGQQLEGTEEKQLDELTADRTAHDPLLQVIQ